MDKILRINMGADGGPQATAVPVGEYAGLGGRAMTSTLVGKEVPPTCHALSDENKLVIAPGLLTGTAATTSGRLSVGCKSPLTGTIKESNSGGMGGQTLARLGYAAIVLEGKPATDDLYKVFINKDGVKITVANDLKMLPNYDLIERLKQEHGEKIACISIGPCGEMKMASATIAVTDMELRPTRHAGRGGVGAVMGAKQVKVIVLDDTGMGMRQPKDPEKFREANKKFAEGLKSHPITGEALPAYGTNVLTNIVNEAGGYPTYNFSQGRFDGAHLISGETEAETEIARGGQATHGCHRGCMIRCSGVYHDKDGHYLTKQPEYETVWAHGGNCGICDLDAIAMLDFLDDNYGVDTIEMGVASRPGHGSRPRQIRRRPGGHRYGEGSGEGLLPGPYFGGRRRSHRQSLRLGAGPSGLRARPCQPMIPRAVQGIGVTYATSTMGADHTAGYAVATNILKVGGDVDPLTPKGQMELSRNLQIATAAVDATGMCLFIAFAVLDQPETFQALIDMINAFYGLSLDANGVMELGKTILKTEREFNKSAGFIKGP